MHGVPALDLDLDGAAGSEARARRAARCFLGGLTGSDRERLGQQTRQDVVLVVSELVCNACRHAPGRCHLTMALADAGVRVTVEDSSRELLRPTGLPGPSGYGLFIVATVGRMVHVERTATGKVVETVVGDR